MWCGPGRTDGTNCERQNEKMSPSSEYVASALRLLLPVSVVSADCCDEKSYGNQPTRSRSAAKQDNNDVSSVL